MHFPLFPCFLGVSAFITMVTATEVLEVSTRAGDKSGSKKFLSYPTLVSILKARNASRPILSQENAQILSMEAVPSPAATSSSNKGVCTPISQEKSPVIQRLCKGRRSISSELSSDSSAASRCLQRYCVAIIPGEMGEDEDDEMAQTGNEIVSYLDCNSVNSLFRVLVRSAVTPRCYDCGS